MILNELSVEAHVRHCRLEHERRLAAATLRAALAPERPARRPAQEMRGALATLRHAASVASPKRLLSHAGG